MVNDLKKFWPNEPVVLNIGLDGPVYSRNLDLSSGQILGRAAVGLRRIMQPGMRGEVVAGRYDEKVLVVSGRWLDVPNLLDSLTTLVVECNQDCIGMWYPSLSEGYLFGPYADEWGSFEYERFIDATQGPSCFPFSQL